MDVRYQIPMLYPPFKERYNIGNISKNASTDVLNFLLKFIRLFRLRV